MSSVRKRVQCRKRFCGRVSYGNGMHGSVCDTGWGWTKADGEEKTHPVDLVEAVHVELPHETRELQRARTLGSGASRLPRDMNGGRLTLLCLKCDPRIVRLNSPTLETTKLAAGEPRGSAERSAAHAPRTELRPLNELRAFRVVDHPVKRVHGMK